ncbi:IS630 family transposase [Leptolyngbya sp. AN03gr2]|uniref:IS630 family transposase n=1 Tax=Leptolyngbya sp. AN03gr2 TaxID=3423364 RepID=UPI003D31102B
MSQWRSEIASGHVRVLFLDECHLVWGDVSGYAWSRRNQRVDVPIASTRERQTYYGALDYLTKQVVVQEYSAGNEVNTVAFLKYLQSCYDPSTRLIIVWDGVNYHRSAMMQEFLAQVNAGLSSEQWNITCVRLAPRAPEQNPIEDVWLQAKQFIRKYARLCHRFWAVKLLFKLATHCQTFTFARAFMYGYCSYPI